MQSQTETTDNYWPYPEWMASAIQRIGDSRYLQTVGEVLAPCRHVASHPDIEPLEWKILERELRQSRPRSRPNLWRHPWFRAGAYARLS